MNRIKTYILSTLLCLMFNSAMSAQSWSAPMSGALLFSSSYGELRNGNIHTGVDIKTGTRTGLPVYATMDGYIARIGVKPYGYGKVLYVAHPNGMTTVYGHLEAFMPEVEEYVRQKRYETEESTIDLWCKASVFPVKKGQQIAASGNTGRSGGPHLHFELRETGSQRLLNPILHGVIKVSDTIVPQIRALHYYEVDTITGVPIHRRVQSFVPKLTSRGQYTIFTRVMLSKNGYFALEAVDLKNNTPNLMGVSSITMKVDGRIRFIYQNDGITFSDTPLHSVIAPFDLRTSGHPSAVRMARYAELKLPFYGLVGSTGIINAQRDKNVEFDVTDDCGNHSKLSFSITYSPAEPSVFNIPEYTDIITPFAEYSQVTGALTVTIPDGGVFETAFYSQSAVLQQITATQPLFSEIYRIGEAAAPLRKNYRIDIEVIAPTELQSKLLLARVGANGKLSSAGGKYRNGTVSGSAASFGTFCVVADTIAPIIKPQFANGVNTTKLKSLTFNISDDFSGIASFRLEVDNQWAIVEHDTMHGKLIYEFDDTHIGTNRTHTIVLTIKDGVGNKTVWNSTFYR